MDSSQQLGSLRSRWLVTGAAGFIGSHLVESLALAGQEVVGLDNFVTGKRENVEAVCSTLARRGVGMRFIEGDVCDPGVVRRAIQGVDYVLHQAAIGSVPRSIEQPLATFKSNIDGFIQVLEAARGENVKGFVYASSSAVYGDHPVLPKREDAVGRLLSPYAASKAIDEQLAAVYSRCYGMRTIGLRYFNVFGPRQDPEGAYAAVIPRWIVALLRGRKVYINGDGETSRDFCFVDNVVQANIKAALGASAEADGTTLNIAAGEQITLLRLFHLLRNLLQAYEPSVADIEPIFRDFRRGDIRHSLASIEKARRLIGYEPTHMLEDGLRASMDWYVAGNTSASARENRTLSTILPGSR